MEWKVSFYTSQTMSAKGFEQTTHLIWTESTTVAYYCMRSIYASNWWSDHKQSQSLFAKQGPIAWNYTWNSSCFKITSKSRFEKKTRILSIVSCNYQQLLQQKESSNSAAMAYWLQVPVSIPLRVNIRHCRDDLTEEFPCFWLLLGAVKWHK